MTAINAKWKCWASVSDNSYVVPFAALQWKPEGRPKMVTGKKSGRESVWKSEGVIEECVDMCGARDS